MTLEQFVVGAWVQGILPSQTVEVIGIQWFGPDVLNLTYRTAEGRLGNELVYRHDAGCMSVTESGRPWRFDGDGGLFRLVAEAHRIRLAHLFDPVLAIHTSDVQPLPHQITAVYEAMLPRQPLRFLLADDPGAGKTIMAGLLLKELIARGDVQRCLIVCPGSLAEQWQDELWKKFNLPFEILTNDKLDAARTDNWFAKTPLAIARLDKLARNEDVQRQLQAPHAGWDLVVCDEAHKLSATHFGGEVKYTRRYRLAQLLGATTRHLLLMTATPHNGKEEDFQLFLALLDSDRFEGRFRDGVHKVEVSDLMRRMVKESLLKFDGTPLFPERIAHTLLYPLGPQEEQLYSEVTTYVREEFDRAAALQNDKRAGTVGFALTLLQRRLASSPQAIHRSLQRRRERLERRLQELENAPTAALSWSGPTLDTDDIDDLEDSPETEVDAAEAAVLDQATAARTLAELRHEIEGLSRLEGLAARVRSSGTDRKWCELSSLLGEVFKTVPLGVLQAQEPEVCYGAVPAPRPQASPAQKLVIFTEHRDTLDYLQQKVGAFLGRREAVQVIHGGMGRDERLRTQDAFRNDPRVQVLIATDAAGEGINLQRAHLMVNYDLPWNPNRLEQRFGRIHRIGQTEVCHLWNLVADQTREGDVYRTLLDKLEQARQSLGGEVFDVLGKLQFDGRPLRDLLIEAIRYGDRPDVRARMTQAIAHAVDLDQLRALLDDHALDRTVMDATRVGEIRQEMERAEARRLQPHYIESFFLHAFRQLGGTVRQRETRRFEVSHVPAPIRNRDRQIGLGVSVQPRYERIVFERSLVAPAGQPPAAFLCPGHPLLDATIDLTLERHGELLRRGTVLVDERDLGLQPRVLLTLEHAIQDASASTAPGQDTRRTLSRKMLFVELTQDGQARHLHYAPYLDYRPLKEDEPLAATVLSRPECAWIGHDLEARGMGYAVAKVVPEHLQEVRAQRTGWIAKTRTAVRDRLTKEIAHWDHRAQQLQQQESAGHPNARVNSREAQRRADDLQARLHQRMAQLDREGQISALPPVVIGGLVVVPLGLLRQMTGCSASASMPPPIDTSIAAARARAVVMAIERRMGFEPTDREVEKLGYDIESRDLRDGHLRFIEVKGRVSGAETITVTRNEILYSLNKPEAFILAIVEFMPDGSERTHYLRQPFQREPDFGVTSVNYDFAGLIARAGPPA